MDHSWKAVITIAIGIILGWWWHTRRARRAAPAELLAPADEAATPAIESNWPANRLHELESGISAFGSNAAHPSALSSHPPFQEAVRHLVAPSVPLDFLLQYAEGANWALSCAALAALKKRNARGQAVERVQMLCDKLSAWAMHFALDFLSDVEPRVPVGSPLVGAKDWWVDNQFMPLMFRDYFARCEAKGDIATFGAALRSPVASPHATVKAFLLRVPHPFAEALIKELDVSVPAAPVSSVLQSVGRFWDIEDGEEILIEPESWRKTFAQAESTLRQAPPRSLLVAGEPLTGKTSFLRLLAERVAHEGWSVFEAGGADLMAGQIYIGQLEGQIRGVLEALDSARRVIWYIPDIVQVARSGTHQGQSASMLEQILPAITAGRLVIWCEATPAGTARLMQLKPSLRNVLEIVQLEPLSAAETLTLAGGLVKEMGDKAGIHFHPDCAEVALETARQYLGTAGLPGSALVMLKLTANRAENPEDEIAPRQVLETLSQLSGLPVSILDTKERIDLKSIRDFFGARVIGQDEAVETIVARIAMLKAGLNDPGKPIGVFLFAGPTGTGKTELAKAAAQFLFGSVERLIRLDMSEFQTPDSIGKIIGNAAAPMDTDSLINRVRKQPFSVLLLDEFEKSHPMIWDIFLQVFDEGRLSDAMGQVADFRHCLIILTSNLGATAHRSLGLGFLPQADLFTNEQVMRAISQTYRPEFQNRLDKVIVFRPLTRELMRGILKKELAALRERRGLRDRAWAVEWESSALEFLLEKGFSPEMGARPLKRAIDHYVVAPLAALIVEKRFPEGEQFVFVRSDGEAIQAEFVDPDAEVAVAAPDLASEQAAPTALAAMILTPAGTAAEFQALGAEHDAIEGRLGSPEWQDLKAKLAADMSAADFWSHADRFGTLARFSLMDRVRAASDTANSLKARLARSERQKSYSRELVARLALQLHLIGEGMRDAVDDRPVELALAVEPVVDAGGDKTAALEWCRRLTAMYRAWAAKRRMQISALPGEEVLLIGGFGVHRTLWREMGLHVYEAREGGAGRATARVKLAAVPLGDVPPAKERKAILAALAASPATSTVMRRYRGEPPLVRNADGKWRTGRLDLVLGGDFDLLEAGSR